nr:MAG TPA: hypothetical protein [Caudoviricetes sp.]
MLNDELESDHSPIQLFSTSHEIPKPFTNPLFF